MFYWAFQNDLPFQVRTELLLVPPLAAQMESNICQSIRLILIEILNSPIWYQYTAHGCFCFQPEVCDLVFQKNP